MSCVSRTPVGRSPRRRVTRVLQFALVAGLLAAVSVGCHYVDNFAGDFPDNGHWGRWDGEYHYGPSTTSPSIDSDVGDRVPDRGWRAYCIDDVPIDEHVTRHVHAVDECRSDAQLVHRGRHRSHRVRVSAVYRAVCPVAHRQHRRR